MGGKWGQYTPEEMACFKAGRMYAYLEDARCRERKNKYSRERLSKLYKESQEFRDAHSRRKRVYYQKHKAELKVQREASQLIKEVNEEEIQKKKDMIAKKKEEQRLKREAQQQEKDKRRSLHQRIQVVRETLAQIPRATEPRPKPVRKNKIPVQRVFEFPTVSHTVIMD
jgi:hypothetical protein